MIRSASPIVRDHRSVASPEQLREVLLEPAEAREMDAVGGSVDAAVLVPLYLDSGDLHAVFTKRRDDLSHHAGEISFPGGRKDFPDEDLRLTALREAEEEIGLPPNEVEVVGALPPVGTFVTNYKIHPFVGVIKPGHAWVPQPTEVEVILELSLPDLIAGHEMKRLVRKGVPFKTPTYTVDGNLIWGATARIVQHLLERVGPLVN
jgi:8-oxo-dGTP pyrophosphatase MutT (NUDIX family)